MRNKAAARIAIVVVAAFGLTSCWESLPSRVPISAIAVVGDVAYIVETDYVEHVNTRGFPETRSPQHVSTRHRMLTLSLKDPDAAPFVAYTGPLASETKAIADLSPYLFVGANGVTLWDRDLLQTHLLQAGKVACPLGEWFGHRTLSAPVFYACDGQAVAYRFDGTSGRHCRFDTSALAGLPRFSRGASPIDRIFAHDGDKQAVIEAAGRHFRVAACTAGSLHEFDPFAALPEAYRPVPRRQGQLSPPPYTRLADTYGGKLLFTSGTMRDRPDVLLVAEPGAQAMRIPLPEALRASPVDVAGPWFVSKGERVLWQLTLPGNRAELVSLDLSAPKFAHHAAGGG